MAKKVKSGRRDKGTATFVKRGDKIRMQVWVEVGGVSMRKSFTASSESACRHAYNQWLQSDNKVAIEKVRTVEQWARHWLEVYKKPDVGWKTYQDYEMYVNKHILAAKQGKGTFGAMKLADVRPAHIAQLYADAKNTKGKQLSHTGLNHMRICLNGIFETAIDNSLCIKNPAKRVPLPKQAPPVTTVFKQKHLDKIIDFMPKHEYGAYVAVLLYSALRKGEFIALLKTADDRESLCFDVYRTLRRTPEGEVPQDKTKTKRGRLVPYDKSLIPYLDKLHETSKGIYLICRKDGRHHSQRSFDICYYKFFDDLNAAIEAEAKNQSEETGKKVVPDLVPRLSPHKCRHTCATFMLREGADIRQIQRFLGHTSIKTTERYTDVDIDDLRGTLVNFGKPG